MIVNIAAWLYIIEAALGLTSLTLSPFGFHASKENLATLLVCGISGAMGVGLLQRQTWGRWLALGSSLLGWTLGTVALLAVIGALTVAGALAGAFGMLVGSVFSSFLAFIASVFVVLWIIGIVISFKLFWYLCSRDGCAEFGVPYGSATTVLASVGAWIAIFVGQYVMTAGGLAGLAAMSAMSRHGDGSGESRPNVDERQQRAIQRELELHASEEQAARRLAQIQAQDRARRMGGGEALAEPANPNDPVSPNDTNGGTGPTVEEAEAPTIGATSLSPPPPPPPAADQQDEARPANKILKCRDASGSLSYTQGYCPPGSKQVDTPKQE